MNAMPAAANPAVPHTAAANAAALRVLVADDERLARQRLRALLADCAAALGMPIDAAEAQDTPQALALARQRPFDVALLDIHMPGPSGLDLAAALRSLPAPPQIVFVTAHAEHALLAFELQAADYLTKPVRLQRLQTALQKALRLSGRHAQAAPAPAAVHAPAAVPAVAAAAAPIGAPAIQPAGAAAHAHDWLLITERQGTLRLPVHEVVYFKAELKYITVRTRAASHLLNGSLSELAQRYPGRFLRIHRNALVARHAMRALVRQHDADDGGDGWAVRLAGTDELLPVSRRQLAAVREVLAHG